MYIPNQVIQEIENLKKERKFEKALDLVNQWLKKDPTNKELLYQIADIQYLMGEIEKAEKPIDFLLINNENDWSTLYIKGVLHMEKLEWDKAKQHFKKAILLLEEENPELYRVYGLSEYWSGNKERGLTFLKQALLLSKKKDPEILYNMVEIYLLEKKYKNALTLVNHFFKNIDKLNFKLVENKKDFYISRFELFKKFIKNTINHLNI